MSEKLIELEEKIAYLDHTIDELNKVVFRQMQKIDELEEMIKHLSEIMDQIKDNSASGAQITNNRPPHY
jgi:SlyX protein